MISLWFNPASPSDVAMYRPRPSTSSGQAVVSWLLYLLQGLFKWIPDSHATGMTSGMTGFFIPFIPFIPVNYAAFYGSA